MGYPQIAWLTVLDTNAVVGAENAAAYGDTCPTVTESEDGATVTVTGDCTTSWDQVYGGSATFTNTESGSTSVYDHFYFENDPSPRGYEVDGGWSWSSTDRTWAADLTLRMLGWTAVGSDVTAIYRGTASDTAYVGYADVLSQPTSIATGDLCFAWDYQPVDSCDSEGDGVIALWGSTSATITYAGSTACDGCGDVTIDGADAGSYCP